MFQARGSVATGSAGGGEKSSRWRDRLTHSLTAVLPGLALVPSLVCERNQPTLSTRCSPLVTVPFWSV